VVHSLEVWQNSDGMKDHFVLVKLDVISIWSEIYMVEQEIYNFARVLVYLDKNNNQ
jgi:hypothetical protein